MFEKDEPSSALNRNEFSECVQLKFFIELEFE